MSSRGYSGLIDPASRWFFQPASIVFWGVLLAFLILIGIGCWLDEQRRRNDFWTDDCFLITERGDNAPPPESNQAPIKAICCIVCSASCMDIVWGPFQDALDDLMSNL